MGQGAKNGTQGAAAADEDLAFLCSPLRTQTGGVCHDRNPGHAGLARGRHADGGRCAMIAETCRSTADPHAARGYPPGVIDPVHTCAWALAINLTKVRGGQLDYSDQPALRSPSSMCSKSFSPNHGGR